MRSTTLQYAVPAPVALAYLSDPLHRPEWQSSLKRVEVLDPGEPHVGQRWRDVTAVGMVPDMVTTRLEPGSVWSESGTWRGVTADLTLTLTPQGTGCRVEVAFEVRGRGALRPVGWAATAAGLFAVRADLAKAGRTLAARTA